MLILSRRHHERIVIDDTITVHVLRFNRHQVTLGIEAPRDCLVYREELYRRIHADDEAMIDDD